jgi:hypothetical protein
VLGELEDVPRRRRAEAVDRLQVVADDRHVLAARAQRAHEVDLQAVDVLVLVDEEVVDGPAHLGADDGVERERAPVQEQVVEVEHAEAALAGAVLDEQAGEVVAMALAPRERLGQELAQRPLGVDRARVDVQQRRLAREAPAGLAHARVLADEVEQVGGVAGVEHAEARGQAERGGVPAHEAVRDRMERTADHAPRMRRAAEVGGGAAQHLARRAAGEGDEEESLGGRAPADEPRHARGQRGRLPGARAREDEQRAARVGGRGALLGVEGVEVARGGGFEHAFGRYAAPRTARSRACTLLTRIR